MSEKQHDKRAGGFVFPRFNATPRTIVGIDPDVEASGIGEVTVGRCEGFNADPDAPAPLVWVNIGTKPLPMLIDTLTWIHGNSEHPVQVFIEAGWLNGGNWHLNPRDSAKLAAAKGRQAGRNHQAGLDICAMLDHHGVPYTCVPPLVKCWQGKDRKITHDELDRILRPLNGIGMPRRRSNQEERDALLLALVRAGLPLRR